MGSYHYRARDLKGALVSGQIAAEDLKSAKRQIALRGLILLTVKESQVFELYFKVKESFKPKVSIEDLVMFSRQMQLIYSVGIPILKGMELVLEQATHPLLKQAVIEITKDLSEGKTLHEAMAKHGTIFDPIYINLVRVGETTGGL
jgi:MSHA biogenesis protein MshG